MGVAEWENITTYLGYAPKGDISTWTCPMLDGNRCSVHPVRPLICRMWGVAENMLCPHGCTAERTLSWDEGQALLAEVYALAGKCHGPWEEWHYLLMKGAKPVELTVGERLTLLPILQAMPLKGKYATLRIIEKLIVSLGLDESDIDNYKPVYETTCPMHKETVEFPVTVSDYGVCVVCASPRIVKKMRWVNPTVTKDIEMGDAARDIIKNELKRMDEAEVLERDHTTLYEKFVGEV
jgi:hypothetical protein